jgi:hypothetical protein
MLLPSLASRENNTLGRRLEKVACKSFDNCAILPQPHSRRDPQQLQPLPVGGNPFRYAGQP